MNKLIEYWKRTDIVEKLLYLYVLLIPMMQVPYLPIVAHKIKYCDIVFLALFITWLAQLLRGKRKIEQTPLLIPLALMLVSFLFSFAGSTRRFDSAIEFAGMAYLGALYFLLTQIIISEDIWWRVIKVWVAVSLAVAAAGLYGYILSVLGVKGSIFIQQVNILGRLDTSLLHRVCSTFGTAGMLAAYLNVSIAFAFILAGGSGTLSGLKRVADIFLISAAYFITGILTKARGIAGISLSVFLILMAYRSKNNIFRFLRASFFVYLIFILFMVIVTTTWTVFPVKFNSESAGRVMPIQFNTAPSLYLALNVSAINMVKAHPFCGVGMGMYNYRSYEYDDPKISAEAYDMMGIPRVKGEVGFDPHSTYLGWAAETGLVGLSFILLFIVSAIYSLYRGMVLYKNHRFLYVCILAGMAGLIINGFFIDILTMRHFWFMIAVGMTLLQLDKRILQENK